MADELMVNGRRKLNSAQLGDYVHKAAQIEKDIYTMQEAEKKFRETAKECRDEKKDKPNLILDTKKEISNFDEKAAMIEISRSTSWNIGCSSIIGSFFAGTFGLAMIRFAIIIVKNITSGVDVDAGLDAAFDPIVYIGGIVGVIVYGVITYMISAKKDKKLLEMYRENHQKEARRIKKRNDHVDEYNAKTKERHIKECIEVENYNKSIEAKALTLEKQADIMHSHLQVMKELRKKFYSVGVIPPDYRTMDCVYVFDQIFRNDLADTMRQAVSIYEERVFRGEIIRGMGTIIKQLGSISGQMSYLVQDINSIKMNVDFMSQDVSKLVDAQAAQQRAVDNILSESRVQTEVYNDILKQSKATRYAAEAVQKCAEDTKKYYSK